MREHGIWKKQKEDVLRKEWKGWKILSQFPGFHFLVMPTGILGVANLNTLLG